MAGLDPLELNCVREWLSDSKKTFDWAEDLIFVVDGTLRIQYINTSAVLPFGLPKIEIIGKPLRRFFAPHSYAVLKQNLLSVLQSNEARAFEEKILCSHGKIWLHTRLTPICDTTGRTIAVLGISRDVTERVRNEDRVLRSKLESERAVDSISYLLAVVDEDYRIRRVNSAMAKMLAVNSRKAVGMVCYEALHGVKHPIPVCPLLQSMANGGEHDIEIREEHQGESFMVNLSSLHDDDGRLVGCIYMGRPGRPVSKGERALAAKRKSKEYMKLLMRQAEYVTTVQDRDGKYLFFSSTPQYGLCSEEIIGKTPFDFFEPVKASKLVERVMRVAANGRPLSQLSELTWNGETLCFFEQVCPIWDSDQKTKSVVTVSRKINGQKGMENDAPASARNVHVGLTGRETQILKLIASGLTNREIGEQLFISKKTVAKHRARLMGKLDVHRSSGLVEYAIKTGLY